MLERPRISPVRRLPSTLGLALTLLVTVQGSGSASPTLVYPARVEEPAIDVRGNGDIFVVGSVVGVQGDAVVVLRSTDGGASFTEWSRFEEAPPVAFGSPSIHIAGGSNERVFVSMVRGDTSTSTYQLQVRYADPEREAPIWTTRTVATATGGSHIFNTSIQSDAADYDAYNVYVAFGSDPPGGWQWVSFSRSVNFGSSWSTPYTAIPATGFLRDISLEWGDDDRLHLATRVLHQSLFDVVYRQATDRAPNLASWSDVQQITQIGDSEGASDPRIAAGESGQVLMTYRRGGAATELRMSSDHGETWDSEADAPQFPSNGAVAAGAAGFAIVSYAGRTAVLSRPLQGDPSGPWYNFNLFALPDTPQGYARPAYDPVRASWGALAGQPFELLFLGEWLVDPTTALPESTPLGAPRDLVKPNPVATNVQFSVTTNPVGQASLLVFTPGGRLVHQWGARAESPGAVLVHEWDGRDRDGLLAPAGVYFYRSSGPDGSRAGRVVRIR